MLCFHQCDILTCKTCSSTSESDLLWNWGCGRYGYFRWDQNFNQCSHGKSHRPTKKKAMCWQRQRPEQLQDQDEELQAIPETKKKKKKKTRNTSPPPGFRDGTALSASTFIFNFCLHNHQRTTHPFYDTLWPLWVQSSFSLIFECLILFAFGYFIYLLL